MSQWLSCPLSLRQFAKSSSSYVLRGPSRSFLNLSGRGHSKVMWWPFCGEWPQGQPASSALPMWCSQLFCGPLSTLIQVYPVMACLCQSVLLFPNPSLYLQEARVALDACLTPPSVAIGSGPLISPKTDVKDARLSACSLPGMPMCRETTEEVTKRQKNH